MAYRRRRHEVLKRHQQRKQQRAEDAIHQAAIERQLATIGKPIYVSRKVGGLRAGTGSRRLNVEALSQNQLNEAESQVMNEIASKSSSAPESTAGPSSVQGAHDHEYQKALADARKLQDELAAQSLVSEEGYREFQERMVKEEKREKWVKVCICGQEYADDSPVSLFRFLLFSGLLARQSFRRRR